MDGLKIIAIRGGKSNPMILNNGDQYDSRFIVLDEKYNNVETFENCNIDPSLTYYDKASDTMKAGILKEGLYGFICIETPKLGKCLWLFDQQYYDKVTKKEDITDAMQTLPSLIPNPNQAGKLIIKDVCIHNGDAEKSDLSMGCQTVYRPDWKRFKDHWEVGDKGYYELIRADGWSAPTWYKGN